MSPVLFAARHFLVIPVLAVAAYMPGRRLLRNLRFDSLAEEAAVCGGLGLGLLGSAIFLLGLAGGIWPPALAALGVAGLLSGGPVWQNCVSRIRGVLGDRPRRRRAFGAILLLFVLLLPAAILALYPPTSFDSTLYHLPVARAYAAAHRIIPLPFVRFSAFPELNEMLSTAGLSLFDDLSAQEIEVLVLLLAGLAGMALATRLFSARAGWLAIAMWFASPYALAAGTSAEVEAALALFGTLALLAAWNAISEEDSRWAAAAGAFAGFAAGTKYLGLFFLVGVLVFLSTGARRGAFWKTTGIFALIAGAAGGPWYVRTAILTGNPVFPFLGRVFGSGPWSAADRLAIDTTHFSRVPRSPENLLRAAADLFFNERIVEAGPSLGLLGYLVAAGVVVLLLRERRLRVWGWALGLAIVPWVFTSRDVRYLVAVLPIAIVLTAGAVESFAAKMNSLPAPADSRWAVAAFGLAIAGPALFGFAQQIAGLGLPPVTAAARDDFIQARFPAYACYRALNDRRAPYTVFGFFDERMTYYASGERIGDYFGPAAYGRVGVRTGSELLESLRPLRAGYVLFSTGPVHPPDDRVFAENFRLVCTAPGAKLYEVRRQ